MYCNHCGVQVAGEARFCPNCSAELKGVAVGVAAAPHKVARHLTVLSALWFAMGALRLVGMVALFMIGTVMLPMIIAHAREPIPFPMHMMFAWIGVLMGVGALLSFVAGWGLYKRERWGRTFAVVMAFLNLLSFPFGTALGIYTLVVLLPGEAEVEWREISG